MGLDVVVGVLADADDECADADEYGDADEDEDDAEYAEYAEIVRTDFVVVRELLDRFGVGPWAEPELTGGDVYEGQMWGYSGLHTVRRLAVHLAEHGSLPEPLAEAHRATDDPLLTKVYASLPSDPAGPYDHLVHHSDCEGYYVPVDFDRVIVDERVTGGYLGSSVRLLAECRRIAAALGLPEELDPDSEEVFDAYDAETPAIEGWRRHGVESYVCLRLIHAAKHSVATGAAIVFC